ncbi:glycosyltransferase family 87 protein [Streptomyces albus]
MRPAGRAHPAGALRPRAQHLPPGPDQCAADAAGARRLAAGRCTRRAGDHRRDRRCAAGAGAVVARPAAPLGARTSGLLIGIACALQPATLLFLPLLWFTGRRRAAVAGAGTFLVCTLATWAVMPDDSWTYWIHHLAGTGLGDPADATANQSLHGVLLRAGLRGPAEVVLLVVLVAGIGWLALRRAVRYARDGQWLLAAAITGCAVVLASPAAWQHQQLWVLLGRRRPRGAAHRGPAGVAGVRRHGDDAGRQRTRAEDSRLRVAR